MATPNVLRAGLLAGLLVGVGCSPDSGASSEAGADDDANAQETVDTEQVPVVRQDVVESSKVVANVGYGATVTLPLQAEGIVTWTPEHRTVLRSGDVVVEVSGRPVVLVIGDSPLYRPLRLVASWERDEAGSKIGSLAGADVAQLQRHLLAEGFDDKGRLEVDEVFGLSTHRAVKDWQASVGHPATGIVDTSQMVFMTTELLLQSQQVVGQQFTQIDVTGTETVLRVVGSTTLREFFAVGSTVDVLADSPVEGVVTSSVRETRDDGQVGQLIEVTVEGVAPEELGQSVEVVGSITRASDALTIPVRALLALSDGGWHVEVITASGTKRVPVELVQVVDTTAVVSGIDEGDEVVVPL